MREVVAGSGEKIKIMLKSINKMLEERPEAQVLGIYSQQNITHALIQ